MNPLSGNPFFGDGASVEQFRDGRPAGVDPYRNFFVAKLTAVTNSGGTNYYAWTEQTLSATTGLPADANPGRSGTATNSPAVEVNNVALSSFPVYVFLRSKGFLNGALCYEFEYAAPGGSSASVGDLIGPDQAQTGQLAVFTDPSGRFVSYTPGLSYADLSFGNLTFGNSTQTRLLLTDVQGPVYAPGSATPRPALGAFASTFQSGISSPASTASPSLGTVYGYIGHQLACPTGSNIRLGYYDATGALVLVYDSYSLGGFSGRYEIYGQGSALRCVSVNIQNWMAHYAADGTAGIDAGTGFNDGLFVARGASITTLGGGAVLADVITKVNEIITRLQSVGVTN